jgi:hypothetical protein
VSLKFRGGLLKLKGAVPAPPSYSIDEGGWVPAVQGGSLEEELLLNYCLLKIT